MTAGNQRKEAPSTPEQLRDVIIESMSDKKAEEIVVLDLRHIEEAVADLFIICHADNGPQINAIAGHIAKQTKEQLGTRPLKTEGLQNLEWVLMDYFDVVVHVFHKEKRAFYKIEDLWADAHVQRFDDEHDTTLRT